MILKAISRKALAGKVCEYMVVNGTSVGTWIRELESRCLASTPEQFKWLDSLVDNSPEEFTIIDYNLEEVNVVRDWWRRLSHQDKAVLVELHLSNKDISIDNISFDDIQLLYDKQTDTFEDSLINMIANDCNLDHISYEAKIALFIKIKELYSVLRNSGTLNILTSALNKLMSIKDFDLFSRKQF